MAIRLQLWPLLMSVCLVVFAPSSQAKEYPSKPISLIVPYAAGTSADLLARDVAPLISARLGQSIVVVNRPGAGAIIGTQAVVRATPDGHTLLFGATQTAINISLYKNLPYDTLRDLVPVVRVSNQPMVLVVNKDLPVQSIQELVAYMKRNPGKLNYADTGTGNSVHLAGAYLSFEADAPMQRVSYNSLGKLIVDMVRGDINLLIYPYQGVSSHLKTGALRALATTGVQRAAFLADLLTMVELGYPDFILPAWQGIFAPAQTPTAVLEMIYRATAEALQGQAITKKLLDRGTEVVVESPKVFADFFTAQAKQYQALVKMTGALPD